MVYPHRGYVISDDFNKFDQLVSGRTERRRKDSFRVISERGCQEGRKRRRTDRGPERVHRGTPYCRGMRTLDTHYLVEIFALDD